MSTLSVIQNDYHSAPDFREGLFSLMMNIVKHCTGGLFSMDQNVFQNVINILVFAMQHEKPELMDLGLQSVHAMTIVVKDN